MLLGRAARHVVARRLVPTCPRRTSLWSGALTMFYTGTKPVMVFTAGAPGAGKTYTLHRLFGLETIEMLDTVEMLDLDTVMKSHDEFDETAPAALYGRNDAYQWANAKVERKFQTILRKPRHVDGRGRIVCFDGTGTHVDRQLRRMREAKDAGFTVVQLYVEVSLETALRRNAERERTVPEHVLAAYLDRLDGAVEATMSAPDLVDTAIVMNNDSDDEFQSGVDRWGKRFDWVVATSRKHEALFGPGFRHTFAPGEILEPPPRVADDAIFDDSDLSWRGRVGPCEDRVDDIVWDADSKTLRRRES